MYMFTRAATDASVVQKFLADMDKTSSANILLLTPLPFPFPEITISREGFPPSMKQNNYETVLPDTKVPNSQDYLGAWRQSSSSLCFLLWQF